MMAGLGEIDDYKSEELGPECNSKSSDSKSGHELSYSEKRLSYSQSEKVRDDSLLSDKLEEELKEELKQGLLKGLS